MDEKKLIESDEDFRACGKYLQKVTRISKQKENAWKVVCSVTTFLPSFLPLVENG